MRRYYPVLSIAGSDSSGGAGIQADIKTISAIGCYAITAITAQNTTGVSAIQGIDPDIVRAQISTVWADIPPLAVKTGMLFSAPIIEQVAAELSQHSPLHLVVDPVMLSTSGSQLIAPDAVDCMVKLLFPMAEIVTPNISEAYALTGTHDFMQQALALRGMGCRNVLLKGGDTDSTDFKTDYLLLENSCELMPLKSDAINTRNTHGTGCTLSSAIASYLALGMDMTEAVSRAKLFVVRGLRSGASVAIGHGHGPMNHLYAPRHMKFQNHHHHDHNNQ